MCGPPNVNFPPFHRFRGWYLTVTLSLKFMTRGRGWEVQWPGRKEGWNKYKINIYITLLLDSLSLTSFWCILRPRLKILDSCKLGILPNPLVACGWLSQDIIKCCLLLAVITFVIWNMEHGWHFSLSFNLFVFCFRLCTLNTYFNNNNLL